MRVFPANWF